MISLKRLRPKFWSPKETLILRGVIVIMLFSINMVVADVAKPALAAPKPASSCVQLPAGKNALKLECHASDLYTFSFDYWSTKAGNNIGVELTCDRPVYPKALSGVGGYSIAGAIVGVGRKRKMLLKLLSSKDTIRASCRFTVTVFLVVPSTAYLTVSAKRTIVQAPRAAQ